MTGLFFVLEGPEGSGKSTLLRALAGRLREHGLDPVMVRDPGVTLAAEALRTEILDRDRPWTAELELLYYVTARADLVTRVIRPALEVGRVVVSDRFDLSTRAYQGAGRGVALDFLEAVNRVATAGLRPDLTLILDVPVGQGLVRQVRAGKQQDRLDRESEAFHARVAARYMAEEGPTIRHLDANRPPDALLEAAWDAVLAVVPPAMWAIARQVTP